jgi:glycosyltransferase involved in cell wall biosynthesis
VADGDSAVSAQVAINARAAVRARTGGVERVASEFAARLPVLRPERYRVVAPRPALAHRSGHAWEQALLPLAARRADLILSPANTAPLADGRNVVYVHDLAPLREPAWFGRAYGAWHRFALRRIAGRALLLLVPSDFVATELRDLLGVEPDRVRVVPPGVGSHLTPAAGPRPPGLDEPYVLALGTPSARKNLGLLDRVAPRLRRAGLETVIAGSGRHYLREAAVSSDADGPGARRLGYVEEADLAALYAHAEALAMPSLYEGFGLPCIEAMACGTPVVAADRGALPEACGGAALLADPENPDAFAAALVEATGPQRKRLTEAGRARAASLSWQRSAELVDAAIEDLLTGRRRTASAQRW